MRVILDANIFISYLLNPVADTPIAHIIHVGFTRRFVLLVPEELMAEFTTTVVNKPYLSSRITMEQLMRFAELLNRVSESVPKVDTIPAVTRDPKDDYLIAYAVAGQADYIVTGDTDLLVLQQVDLIRIYSPQEFIIEALSE